jgi:type I restriction enzyme M protein
VSHHDIRRRIEAIWEEFWRAGLSDPADIIEQMLYLLFLRRLDDLQVRSAIALRQARRGPRWSPASADDHLMRWSRFKDLGEADMFALLADHVYPRLRRLGGPGSAYAQHMKDARFGFPTAAALAKVVRLVEALPRPAGARGCAAYDYLAGKLARIGRRGEFYTPRHIARLMIALVAPRPGDLVCSPVGGDGNFMVGVGEYLAQRHPGLLDDPDASEHFHHRMFHAYDADKTMLRIACMNMALHGVANPNIRYTNSIAPDLGGDEDCYSVLLAHPSTASLPGAEHAASTAQAEILMVAQFVRLLKRGGRAAVIVPQHILGGHSRAHLELRRSLVEEQRLDAVIAFPAGLSGNHAGAPKAILLFTRTDCGGRDHVWFCEVQSGGWTADAICSPQRNATRRVGYAAPAPAPGAEYGNSLAPEVMRRWQQRGGGEIARRCKARGFCVQKEAIANASNCLAAERYQAGSQADG